jgi:hypothetical protein
LLACCKSNSPVCSCHHRKPRNQSNKLFQNMNYEKLMGH